MYEVKFDENINLESTIVNSNKEKEKLFTLPYLMIILSTISVSLAAVSYFDLHLLYDSTQLLTGILAVNGIVDGTLLLSKIIINSSTTTKKKKSKSRLSKVASVLANHNIKTNAKELSDSVLFERVSTLTKTIVDEDISTTRDDTQEDKCFAFLDRDSEIQGLLERTITTEIDEEKASETKYYVLEEPELKEVRPRVEMVKKLVRKPNRNIDTKSKR